MISHLEIYEIQNLYLVLGGEGIAALDEEPKVT